MGVDGDRARFGVEHLENAGSKLFDRGVVEFALDGDGGLGPLVSRVDTEQRDLRGLPVITHTAPLHTRLGNAAHWAGDAAASAAYSSCWRSGRGARTPARPGRPHTPALGLRVRGCAALRSPLPVAPPMVVRPPGADTGGCFRCRRAAYAPCSPRESTSSSTSRPRISLRSGRSRTSCTPNGRIAAPPRSGWPSSPSTRSASGPTSAPATRRSLNPASDYTPSLGLRVGGGSAFRPPSFRANGPPAQIRSRCGSKKERGAPPSLSTRG